MPWVFDSPSAGLVLLPLLIFCARGAWDQAVKAPRRVRAPGRKMTQAEALSVASFRRVSAHIARQACVESRSR